MIMKDLLFRTRSLLRDLNNDTFRYIDLEVYMNEAIDRIKQVIPELRKMPYLENDLSEVKILPEEYHHLLALYTASRLYFQDERTYQASNLMNEFEEKLFNLKSDILNGELTLLDEEGLPIPVQYVEEHVKNVYFKIKT